MSHERAASLVALASLLALAGCTSSSGGAAPSVPRDRYLVEFTAAICEPIGPCCVDAGYGYDVAKCKASLATGLRQAVDDLTRDYDAALAGRCLELARTAAGACFEGGPLAALQACDRILVPTLAPGTTCVSSAQCAVPADADRAICSDGKCVAVPRGKRGDACGGTCRASASGGSECWSSSSASGPVTCWTEDGLFCGPDGACRPLAALGAACTHGACIPTAYCAADGKCASLGGPGAPCPAYDSCLAGLYCAADSRCGAVKPVGAACVDRAECESGRCDAKTGECAAETILTADLCGGTSSPVPTP